MCISSYVYLWFINETCYNLFVAYYFDCNKSKTVKLKIYIAYRLFISIAINVK